MQKHIAELGNLKPLVLGKDDSNSVVLLKLVEKYGVSL